MNNNNENEVMAEGNGQVEAAEAAQRAQEAVERETARVAAAQAAAAEAAAAQMAAQCYAEYSWPLRAALEKSYNASTGALRRMIGSVYGTVYDASIPHE